KPQMPAKSSETSETQAFPLFVRSKKAYTLSETTGLGGRLKSRSISGPDFTELLIDKDDDGFVDVVQVTRGPVTTTASWPFKGQFRRIDVENKLKKGILKVQLLLSYDRTAYEIVSQRMYPYEKFGAEMPTDAVLASLPVAQFFSTTKGPAGEPQGEVCPVITPATTPVRANDGRLNVCENPAIINSLSALDSALRAAEARTGRRMEDILTCQLNKFERVIMDPGCFGSRWSAANRGEINAGLGQVMASHYEPTPAPGNPGTYMQCLNSHGWSDSATKVQQHVWERFRNVSSALMAAGFTAEDFAALFSEVNPDQCQPRTEVTGRFSGRRVNLNEINATLSRATVPPAIACSPTESPYRRAEFDNGTIRFFATSNQIKSQTPNCSGACTATSAYASTVFHELIHASGFGEEHHEIVENAERCCSPVRGAGDTGRDVPACVATSRSARFIALLQRNQTMFTSLFPQYNAIVERVDRQFEPYGNRMIDEYTGRLTQIIDQHVPSLTSDLRACEQRPAAQRESCKSNAFNSVNAAAREETNTFFSATGQCTAYAKVGIRQPRATAADCTQLRDEFTAMLNRPDNDPSRPSMETIIVTALPDAMQVNFPEIVVPRIDLELLRQPPTAVLGSAGGPGTRPIGAGIQTLPNRAGNPGIQTVTSSSSLGELSDVKIIDNFEIDRSLPDIDPIIIDAFRLQPVEIPSIQAAPSSPTTIVRTSLPPAAPAPAPVSRPSSPTTIGRFEASETARPSQSPPPTFSSGLSMPAPSSPSTTNGSATLGVGDENRPDGITPRRLPIADVAARVSSTVANIGQAVVSATIPQAAAAQERLASAPPARPPPPARAPAAVPQSQAAAEPAAALPGAPSLGLRTASTVIIGSAVGNTSISVPRPRMENPLNPIRVQPPSAADKVRERLRAQREGGGRPGEKTEPRGAAARGGPASGGGPTEGDERVEAQDEEGGSNSASRDRTLTGDAKRTPEVVPGSAQPGRSQTARIDRNYRRIRDATVMQSWIRKTPVTEMNNLLTNRDFVQQMRSVGVAVRNRNGARVGAPPPAPLMEQCTTRQQFVLEGTCR
ncbi:MAG: hypothetical protein AAB250_18555, partial [Bdellovibrionota bacterium]